MESPGQRLFDQTKVSQPASKNLFTICSERLEALEGPPERCPRDPRSGIGLLRRATSRAATRRAVRRSGVASIAKRGRPAPPCAAQRRNRSIYEICEDAEHRPTRDHGHAARSSTGSERAHIFKSNHHGCRCGHSASAGLRFIPAEPAPSVASLAARIQRHIEQPRFSAAQWGIKIVSMDTGRTVFERNADKYCIPASNAKLYTGALALDAFAPGMRIPTRLYATAPIDSKGVTNGHLVLYGQGDPTFGAATETGAAQSPFDALAAQLAQTGLKRVRGHLVINDRYFGTPPIGAGWQAD